MKARGVQRVYILVRNLEKTVDLYSKLLGATFHVSELEHLFGARAALSWDAGIEIMSPVPGSNNPMALAMEQYMAVHGEGLYGVGFRVDSADEFRDNAQKMGIGAMPLEFTPEQIKEHFEDRFKVFKEYLLSPADTFGVNVVAVELEAK